MTIRAVIFADRPLPSPTSTTPAALLRLYGVTMLERHFRTLAALGITDVTVIGSPEAGGELVQQHLARIAPTVSYLDAETPNVPRDHRRGPGSETLCLLITAHHVYDQRALDAVIRSGPNTILIDSSRASDSATDDGCGLALVDAPSWARLTKTGTRSAQLWASLDELGRRGECRRLNIHDLNPYIINLRRSIPPFWLAVTSTQEIRTGEAHLIDVAQKGTLDLPAQYLHPPLENWMVRRLAGTAVTPNQVTTVTNLIAFIATGFLISGALVPGLLIAALVGVLDGVDGKLARVTVRCSKFGDRFEHILDNVYELSWYWALGWALSGSGLHRMPLVLSGTMTVFYLLDRAATGLFKHVRGIELFDYAWIDRMFRRIGGRRNIYVLLLLVGVLMRTPLGALWAVSGWSVVTAVFHGWRAFRLLVLSGRDEQPTVYTGQAAS